MRNVNEDTDKLIADNIKGFILTMRNVNFTYLHEGDIQRESFILTMRNVNIVFENFVDLSDLVLY